MPKTFTLHQLAVAAAEPLPVLEQAVTDNLITDPVTLNDFTAIVSLGWQAFAELRRAGKPIRLPDSHAAKLSEGLRAYNAKLTPAERSAIASRAGRVSARLRHEAKVERDAKKQRAGIPSQSS